MSDSLQALVGQSLGQYRIVEQIGEGGMAAVFEAFQPSLNRQVALKVLPPSFARQGNFTERFEREAQAIGNLHHPHILAVYDYGQDSGYSFIVMRYIPQARTLADLMKQPLKTEQIIELTTQIAGALDHAHQRGIIHRDIKPSNVLMDGDWPLLSDFGLAKMTEDVADLTGTGAGMMGTPSYMSPEQGTGKAVDHRTDIYALGIILYEMLTGTVPHKAETPIATIMKRVNEPLPLPRRLNPNISPAVERVLLKALATQPEQRFDSAGEMAEALKRAFGPQPAEVLADVDQTYVEPPPGEATNIPLAEQTSADSRPAPDASGGSRFILPVNIFGFSLTYVLIGVALLGIAALLVLQLWPERSPITWMYVLDLSSQMQEPFPGESVISKWEAARASLSEDLAMAPEEINLGLRVFGQAEGESGCTETELVVEPDPGQVSAIQNSLGGLSPTGNEAPLTEAIVQTMNNLELSPDKRNAMVILTSGQDSCEPDAVAQVGTLVQRLNVEVDTYVVGLAIEDPLVEASLQELAAAGNGVYRPANSLEELEEALEDIRENLEDNNDPQEIALAPTPTPTSTPTPTPTATSTPTVTPSPTTTPTPAPILPDNMNIAREQHAAVLLPDGQVLVAGGTNREIESINSAELFNPDDMTWNFTGSMNMPREDHTLTLLQDDTVLAVGGDNGNEYGATTEIYDPNSETWTIVGNLIVGRERHTATLLNNGTVLVVGGVDREGSLASTELYNPANQIWSSTNNMNSARSEHTATLLEDGRVLVSGGRDDENTFASVELYDPNTEAWTLTGNMNIARREHSAVLLNNGNVLVAGGIGSDSDVLASVEIYDPNSETWSIINSMKVAHGEFTATLLNNGQVLVVGGENNERAIEASEIYNPETETWTQVDDTDTARTDHVAVLLNNGNVLITGGDDDSVDVAFDISEIYNVEIGAWNEYDSAPAPVQLQEGFGND